MGLRVQCCDFANDVALASIHASLFNEASCVSLLYYYGVLNFCLIDHDAVGYQSLCIA